MGFLLVCVQLSVLSTTYFTYFLLSMCVFITLKISLIFVLRCSLYFLLTDNEISDVGLSLNPAI